MAFSMKSESLPFCFSLLFFVFFCFASSVTLIVFIPCRLDFKFFSEMDGIFRKQLKADDSDSELLVPEEPEDCVVEPELSRGGI